MDKFTKYCIVSIIAYLFILGACVAGLWYIAINNSKENETCGGAVSSAEYQANSPDDHALPQSHYDTSYLELWCGEPTGQIRMIGGWYHSPDTIETEDGNLWGLNTEDINEYELLLIWFDDMGTPEIEDDEIIKVWSEVYD